MHIDYTAPVLHLVPLFASAVRGVVRATVIRLARGAYARSLALLLGFLVVSRAGVSIAEEAPSPTKSHSLGDWFEDSNHEYFELMRGLSNYHAPPTIPIGLSVGARQGHFIFGTEVSFVVPAGPIQVGAYVDGLYGDGRYCFSAGPEVVLLLLVLDGGYMGCASSGPFVNHWVGRATLSAGVIGLYGRLGTHDYWDAGVLLKIPWGWSMSGVPMR